MLYCNSVTLSAKGPIPSSYLFLELLVDLVAIRTTSLLRIIIDPIPKYTVVCFGVFVARSLRRLYDRANVPNISFGRPNLVIIKIL